MHIDISLEYFTNDGETVAIDFGKGPEKMVKVIDGIWASVKDIAPANILSYSFSVMKDGNVIRKEWKSHDIRIPFKSIKNTETFSIQIRDRWTDVPDDMPLWSKAFTDVIFKNEPIKIKVSGNVSFTLCYPDIRSGEVLAMTGSGPMFNDWKKFIPLGYENPPYRTVFLNVSEPFEYKFVILDAKTGEPKIWESGPNHFLAEVPAKYNFLAILNIIPSFDRKPWKGTGTVIPVFSLRSEDSFGVGEFEDLRKLADWASETGQNVIQLLPVNDTTMTRTWTDSYPYSSISSFALHPLYLSLTAAGLKPDNEYEKLQKELNSLQYLDYEKVLNEKEKLARKLFHEQRKSVQASPDFKKFRNENDYWLKPYAAFCVLRDNFNTADFRKWKEYSEYDEVKVSEYCRRHSEKVEFYMWLQYLLDRQLKGAIEYAHSKGIAIKGDIPIGVSKTSVETWQFPSLFNLDSQAGAPPDAFSADGQNWGFPTYNWDEMAKDGYKWWKERLRKMSEYFDAFRIDHILGFFRIWEIPADKKSGLDGHFNPALPYTGDELRDMGFDPNSSLFVPDPHRDGLYHPRISAQLTDDYRALNDTFKDRYNSLYNDFFYHRNDEMWRKGAVKKLSELLGCTKMLACGEDLGMIPDCVPQTMREFKILSLEVQRMPKSQNEEFGDPNKYPYLSVCTTSSHDTSTLRAWWEEDRALIDRYYHEMLHCSGETPYFCEPWVCERIIDQHLQSPSMLCILPLQDWASIDASVRYPGDPKDERINVPAEVPHYWRWRMPITLEDLLSRSGFNEKVKGMIARSRA
jgi:4-alpha-glucanotransferase